MLSRLIDADELLSYVDRVKNCGLGKKKTIEYITKYINNMPTAYDVDKVVVKLEARAKMNLQKGMKEYMPDEARPYLYAYKELDEVIDIVKAGGIADE